MIEDRNPKLKTSFNRSAFPLLEQSTYTILCLRILPLQAQNIDSETEECRAAIASVENQLETGRQLQIEVSGIEKHYYPDHPEGRPNEYGLGVSGDAARSVMSSPMLMSSLAELVINSCNSISLISFNLYQTGAAQVFGLMPNKKVEVLQCPADYDDYFPNPYPRELTWGEFCST